MKVSEVFAMGGGGCGHECDRDCHYGSGYGYSGYSGYSGYYPDYGRWSYHYYNGYSSGGYGYSRSRGLLGILG